MTYQHSPVVFELARVIHDYDEAMSLLLGAGFPMDMLPEFTTSRSFWHRVTEKALNGSPPGMRAIVAAAATMYPSNQTFRAYLVRPSALLDEVTTSFVRYPPGAATRQLPSFFGGQSSVRSLPDDDPMAPDFRWASAVTRIFYAMTGFAICIFLQWPPAVVLPAPVVRAPIAVSTSQDVETKALPEPQAATPEHEPPELGTKSIEKRGKKPNPKHAIRFKEEAPKEDPIPGTSSIDPDSGRKSPAQEELRPAPLQEPEKEHQDQQKSKEEEKQPPMICIHTPAGEECKKSIRKRFLFSPRKHTRQTRSRRQ